MQKTMRIGLIILGIAVLVGLLFWSQSKNNQKVQTQSEPEISITSPQDLNMMYAHSTEWPPAYTIKNTSEFSCTTEKDETSGIEKGFVKINNLKFCKTTSSEGAAGSVYYTYSYEFIGGEIPLVQNISFGVRMPQCLNYDSPQKEACSKEQGSFDPDDVVAQMVYVK